MYRNAERMPIGALFGDALVWRRRSPHDARVAGQLIEEASPALAMDMLFAVDASSAMDLMALASALAFPAGTVKAAPACSRR